LKSPAPFTIYDAAAGSGKTFTLVKEFLIHLFQNKKSNYYQHMLALTFTNKAVAEMKERVIESLTAFSKASELKEIPQMMQLIASELNIEVSSLQRQSSFILKDILHNYAALSIETIDGFNHRLIRTFARDLKLPSNFEVLLDTDPLLTEAIDNVISKTGIDNKITKALVDFTLLKADDDKSWDIAKDIFKTSKLLTNENDQAHIANLKDKRLDDFTRFYKELEQKKNHLEKELIDLGNTMLTLLTANGLDKFSFSGGYFYTYFLKIANGDLNVSYGAQWQEKIGVAPLYSKGVVNKSPEIASTMDQLDPQFKILFDATKAGYFQIQFIQSIQSNLNPLQVINLVSIEIEKIKEAQNVIPISQFNTLIHNEIKNQPTPFIYERLGERYHHYFIDEFQDTSVMQWGNMVPLIDNTLSQRPTKDKGSLLLVGDVKQSIYRWRGGNPEQFVRLINKKTPFNTIPDVLNLPKNYRSLKEIVLFNNEFFSFTSQFLSNPLHEKLYVDGNKQEVHYDHDGFVQLAFIETENKEEKHKAYAEKTIETIVKLIANGFRYGDICILTRKKADGVALSTTLMEAEIPVISAETLLVNNSPLVRCIINCLSLSVHSVNNKIKAYLLDFLHEHLTINIEKHDFLKAFINKDAPDFSVTMERFGINFKLEKIKSLSLYEAAEYIISAFKIDTVADAYIYALMDLIFDFQLKPQATKASFLDYWEIKKEKASIASAQQSNGVQFMTVHKAKGLEFPAVIFPYADEEIYREIEPKIWMPVPDNYSDTFNEALISFNNNVSEFGEIGATMHAQRQATLELDNFNLLYVTLTRAVEQLYIFSEKPSEPKNGIKTFNHLFLEFLKSKHLWQEEQLSYEFGAFQKRLMPSEREIKEILEITYISSTPSAHNLHITKARESVFTNETIDAILIGNLFHDTMEKITSAHDAASVFENLKKSCLISKEQLAQLQKTVVQVLEHPDLHSYFSASAAVAIEKDIITKDGFLLRPDRLNFSSDSKSVAIIDYKTGVPSYENEEQIERYAQALEEMGYTILEKILVYTQDQIVVNKL
jgi:ATP-dependent exoDNAse (exonuclease V) beta subunit